MSFRGIISTLAVLATLIATIRSQLNLAPLKPLTAIAGTNLFLNVPYKWLDRTKPNCYAMWFWDTYKDYSGKHRGVSMVCNRNDQQWYNTTNADWIFERTDDGPTDGEYRGTVKIVNVGTNKTLENWKSAGTYYVGIGVYDGKPSEDMWNVQSDPENKNNLQLGIQKWYLAEMPAENFRAYLFLKKEETNGFHYQFVPVVKLVGKMSKFEFIRPNEEEFAKRTSKKGLIDAYTIKNDSPVTISRKITVSEKITNEFSWGLSESFKALTKVSGKVGIPLIAESKVEVSYESNLGAKQDWKNSVEKKFELSYDVNVPRNTEVTISAWYDLIEGISMDYTATTEITGSTVRVSVYNDIVEDMPATGNMILSQLLSSNFDAVVESVNENSVIVKVKGTMVASVGVRGRLDVNGSTVKLDVDER